MRLRLRTVACAAGLAFASSFLVAAPASANTPPTAPTVLSPENFGYRSLNNVTLTAAGSRDAEGQNVSLQFTVGFFGAATVWTSPWIAAFGLAGNAASVVVPASSVRAGQVYIWSVRARDSLGAVGPPAARAIDIFSNYQPGASGFRYDEAIFLGGFGPRETVNSGLTQVSSATLKSVLADLPSPGTVNCTALPSGLQSQMASVPTGRGTVTLLAPLAQGMRVVMHEIQVKEPALYDVLVASGGLCYRNSKNASGMKPGTVSPHSWGTALDIKLTSQSGYEFYPSKGLGWVTWGLVRTYFYLHEAGWIWGFGFSGDNQDNMHFEIGLQGLNGMIWWGQIHHA